jgi:hypothetical protein
MYMIEKVTKPEFPKNVIHKPLKLNPSKNLRFPSPRVEHEPGHEGEIFEEGTAQPDLPQAGAQTVTGLTGGVAGSTTGHTDPPLLCGSFSTSYLGCAGANMTSKLSNKGREGQTSK